MNETSSGLHSDGRVLAVDDQPDNLTLVEAILTKQGFTVELAADGQEALEAVDREIPDCIVLDVMMPRLDGFAVCDRLKRRRETHFVPIVMLTALSGTRDKVRAYELGADDFLNKPVNIPELVARVRSMIRIKRLRDELDTSDSIIVSMVEALESKDPPAAGHSARVTSIAVQLARRPELSGDSMEVIAKGSILHDIGKIGLPVELLQRPTRLRPDERKLYQSHTVLGERILAPFLSFARVRAVVRHHHERLDGSGYPDSLAGPELDLETEIVALANIYDHLASHGMSHTDAIERLRDDGARGVFHAHLVSELAEVTPLPDDRGPPQPWQELVPLPDPQQVGHILIGSASTLTQDLLAETLTEAGHELRCYDSDQAVVEALSNQRPDMVLLDMDIPDSGGLELCRRIKSTPDTEFLPVVLVANQYELDSRSIGPRVGADDFLILPINRLELKARVNSLLRVRLYFKDLEEHHSVILSLAAALEARDPYTRGHSERVGVLAAQLGRALGMDEERCRLLRFAGQLHDIGKIGMPGGLLNKQGRLDAEELATVRQHPLIGERICRPLRTMQRVLPLVRHHHERLDGSGYPDGLSGEDLPRGAGILGIADAYDAITSARSYRRNFSTEQALELLGHETASGCWDPEVFSALASIAGRS